MGVGALQEPGHLTCITLIPSVKNRSCASFLQTFVNDVRIPDQKYITLKLNDVIRFGYDILIACRWSGTRSLPGFCAACCLDS